MVDNEIEARLANLRAEHRELDKVINGQILAATVDQLYLARLKRRKLALRDEIAMIEDRLIPDIIA